MAWVSFRKLNFSKGKREQNCLICILELREQASLEAGKLTVCLSILLSHLTNIYFVRTSVKISLKKWYLSWDLKEEWELGKKRRPEMRQEQWKREAGIKVFRRSKWKDLVSNEMWGWGKSELRTYEILILMTE